MEEKKETFISINRNGIKYGYYTHHVTEDNGMISSYIPAFDIYYSSPDKERASKRAVVLVTSFLNFWVRQQGFRAFVLQILKLGFKAPNHKELKQLLERKNINTKLNSTGKIPEDFLHSEAFITEGELEVAM